MLSAAVARDQQADRQLGELARTKDIIVKVVCSAAVESTLRLCGMPDIVGLVLDLPGATGHHDEETTEP